MNPSTASPSVSIAVVNYNGAAYVSAALESALAQRYPGPIDVIVLDNASSDRSLSVLNSFSRIRVLESRRNLGYGAGANAIVGTIATDYVAFLNPDAIADADWLAAMIPWMRRASIDLASSVVRAGSGIYFAGGIFVEPLGATLVRNAVAARTDWIGGCAMIANVARFRALGGFDEAFFLYSEDVDLSLRANAAGYRLGIFPRALVDHPQAGSSTNQLGIRKAEIAFESRGRLVAKHVRRRWQPLALAFTATLAPLRNGVGLRALSRVAGAVLRGFRSARRVVTPSDTKKSRPTLGILANIYEPDSGIRAGGHLHFIEVVKRWDDVDLVLFAPSIAREAFAAALPQARFIAMPASVGSQQNRAFDFLFRALASALRLKQLRDCDALLSTSHLLPDVLPAVLSRRPAAVVVHHLLTSGNEGARATLIPAIGERLSLEVVRAGGIRAVIALSELIRDQLRARRLTMPMVVSSNGVDHLTYDCDLVSPRSGAVFVGRLHPLKNVDHAIRAWRYVHARFPSESLTIIGVEAVPSYAAELKRLVDELGLRETVRFAGAVDDRAKLAALRAAKLFIFPSAEEGWGIALAEAMRCGLPCITYDLPIFGEIFPTGRLEAPLGDYRTLAARAEALLADDALFVAVSEQAARLGRSFTWERASRIEATVLESLLTP